MPHPEPNISCLSDRCYNGISAKNPPRPRRGHYSTAHYSRIGWSKLFFPSPIIISLGDGSTQLP
ncbi:uncharacterized protein BYT42DRAFT_561338 [Radiomyces spectabilis]|uniref:uncharacterized protein n=1 Tax=Radiomyces spectabilis TaxID=64574 RepID=UPI0022205C17|nr:uncharacterized protein BYT42DRAFT_561338 [Radiomyces spectabilis]KAI8388818.1 hypothetical protein BYT42DRAFT_561338 [Radiomyces spectabilis]